MATHVFGGATFNNSGYDGKWVENNTVWSMDYFKYLRILNYVPLTNRNVTTWRFLQQNGEYNMDYFMTSFDISMYFDVNGSASTYDCPVAAHGMSSIIDTFLLNEDRLVQRYQTGWAKLTRKPA